MAFLIYWKDGRKQIVEGETFDDACNKAGIGWKDHENIDRVEWVGVQREQKS